MGNAPTSAYGAQSPANDSQPPAYDASSAAQPTSAYGAQSPANDSQPPAYDASSAAQPASAYGSSAAGVAPGSTYDAPAPTYASPAYNLPPGYGIRPPAYQPWQQQPIQQPGAYQQPAAQTTPGPV